MKPIGPEIVCFWIAAVLYGVAATLQLLAVFQKKKYLTDYAMKIAWIGLITHSFNFFLPAVRQNYTGL